MPGMLPTVPLPVSGSPNWGRKQKPDTPKKVWHCEHKEKITIGGNL